MSDVWDWITGEGDARAIRTAGEAQTAGLEEAISVAREMLGVSRGLLNPYIGAGSGGIQAFQRMLGIPDTSPISITNRGSEKPNTIDTSRTAELVKRHAEAVGRQEGTLNRFKSMFPDDTEVNRENLGKFDVFKADEELSPMRGNPLGGFVNALRNRRDEIVEERIEEAKQGPLDTFESLRAEVQPEYERLVGLGEEAINQYNASIGKLHSGDAQEQLFRFRPELMNRLIEQRRAQKMSGLLSLMGMGQQSAGLLGNQGIMTGANIGAFNKGIGEAMAQSILGQHKARNQGLSNMFELGMAGANLITGAFGGLGGFGGQLPGGTGGAPQLLPTGAEQFGDRIPVDLTKILG